MKKLLALFILTSSVTLLHADYGRCSGGYGQQGSYYQDQQYYGQGMGYNRDGDSLPYDYQSPYSGSYRYGTQSGSQYGQMNRNEKADMMRNRMEMNRNERSDRDNKGSSWFGSRWGSNNDTTSGSSRWGSDNSSNTDSNRSGSRWGSDNSSYSDSNRSGSRWGNDNDNNYGPNQYGSRYSNYNDMNSNRYGSRYGSNNGSSSYLYSDQQYGSSYQGYPSSQYGMSSQYGYSQYGSQDQRQSGSSQYSDSRLAEQIQDSLRNDPSNKYNNVSVTANEGYVTLKGSVANQNDKDAIEQRLRDMPGVQNINNQITVKK